ncbi:TraB/GumN family protein [Kordiimonas aquimaris]|uniref:TraB/GumN family protein n=1 Tax=Kordiimonas aquimaris TaxID=707591 RepID=UPI0021CF51C7|nr:TraB/GumN family protein [Kordiimonas aquimaris]
MQKLSKNYPLFSKLLFSVIALSFLSVLHTTNIYASNDEAPRPALWKLTDADSEIYLFGTIHILNPSLTWRSEKVSAAFNAAPTVYFETPADTSNPQAMQELLRQYGLNKPGVTLSSQLSEDGQKNLSTVMNQLGMGSAIANFEPFRPWLAGVTLASMQIQANGGNPNAGVERILSAEAKTSGKDIGYFESDAQQIAFFGNMSKAAETRFFEIGLEQMLQDPNMLDNLVDVWRRGNVAGVEEQMLAAFEGHPEVYETLLVRRNQDWAEQIDRLMGGSGTIFIAVGAAHLAGKDSVQALLGKFGHIAVRQ